MTENPEIHWNEEARSLSNHLSGQTSPYLLQHAKNPVDWYPWCAEAFERAEKEDKPVFLSIGYSTCHWCHVMAHESFEDPDIADLLNKFFISIKVDREERPDIDNVYMAVCQALTGSGGWPTSIFMTPDQKPFFAGTYFPKTSRGGMIGFRELLLAIQAKWITDRAELTRSAEDIVAQMKQAGASAGEIDPSLPELAEALLQQSFDREVGGFGQAPKFPAPHTLLFLLDCYEKRGNGSALEMAEITLRQMYRGGLFDHIGYGFSRYSTDRYFLIPHFEKMLYDNALLILCYAKAFDVTQNPFYREVAMKTADYVLRELTGPDGEFYCAQDADSGGAEGRYYVFWPREILWVLGDEAGRRFNDVYGITEEGNFESGSIPNLLGGGEPDEALASCLPKLRAYRRERASLHLDDKVLTAWNSLMIAALSTLYRVSGQERYLTAAERAEVFLAENLRQGDTLSAGFRKGRRSGPGYLDDYAFYIFAQTALYEATLDERFLETARRFCDRTETLFRNEKNGGFTLSSRENEQLIFDARMTYDGAMPSGNSMMAYNLVRLVALTDESRYLDLAERQLAFLAGDARRYPAGYCFYLLALSHYLDPPRHITVILKNGENRQHFRNRFGLDTEVRVISPPTEEFPLLNGKTTFYVCQNHSCRPPTNEIPPEREGPKSGKD